MCPTLLIWNLVTAGSLLLQYLHTFGTLGIVDAWYKSLPLLSHSPYIYYKIILNKGNHYHGRHGKFSAARSYPLEINCNPRLRLLNNFLNKTVYKHTWLMELGNKELMKKRPEQVWSLQNSLFTRSFISNTIRPQNFDLKLVLTNKVRAAVRTGTTHARKSRRPSLGKEHALWAQVSWCERFIRHETSISKQDEQC